MELWIRRVATLLKSCSCLVCGDVVLVVANRIDELLMVFARAIDDGIRARRIVGIQGDHPAARHAMSAAAY